MNIEAFKYKMWADGRTLKAIDCIDKTKFTKEYNFVLQQINHMIIIEDLFRSRMENLPAPHKVTNTEIVPDFVELSTRLLDSGKWYINYVSNLSIKTKQKSIPFSFAEQKYKMNVEEMLFHVLNHGTYHRGSIAHALDLATVPHPVDGFCAYIHEAEPSRRN